MGICTYCGKDAGLLRSSHKQCKEAHESGKQQILQLITEKATKDSAPSIKEIINKIAESSFIDQHMLMSLGAEAWQKAVEKALEDEVLSREEEDALTQLKNELGLDSNQLDSSGGLTKLMKAAVIRDLLEGNIPHRVEITGNIPFNLQKDEGIVWLFKNVKYYEERTSTSYQGGSSGISVRVVKGLYYRTGGFRGNPVTTTSMVHIDTGSLGVTDKHIYFAGARKAFRIPYKKIVTFRPYTDGIGLQRDAMSAKPQVFVLDDGWFIHNLVTNLANIART